MGGRGSRTFQQSFMDGMEMEHVKEVLDTIFRHQLGRLYEAATHESCDLLEYYCFSSAWAGSVRAKVEELLGGPVGSGHLTVNGHEVPDLCQFYEEELDRLPARMGSSWFPHLHGDLNGANIILDGQDNVWLIDFFHAHHGHLLKDLIKLENDLLYIFTPVPDDETLSEGFRLIDALLDVQDLARPLPSAEEIGLKDAGMRRAWEVVTHLRGIHAELVDSDRDPLQVFIGQLRYAVHTMGSDECNHRQKLWALYTAARCSGLVTDRLQSAGPLRVDWLPDEHAAPGRVGLTMLPGRRDRHRNIAGDVQELSEQGVTAVACVINPDEFALYGVEGLLDAYDDAGFKTHHLPIVDGSTPRHEQMEELVGWMTDRTGEGGRVLIHCVGGLGRAGTVAACFLKTRGLDSEQAIRVVRETRSRRAIETTCQERFARGFEPAGA
jgi:protein-tyrosine phosphatase